MRVTLALAIWLAYNNARPVRLLLPNVSGVEWTFLCLQPVNIQTLSQGLHAASRWWGRGTEPHELLDNHDAPSARTI